MDGLEEISSFLEELGVEFLDCSQPGAALGDLPHCCSNAGVIIGPGEWIHVYAETKSIDSLQCIYIIETQLRV